MQHWLTSSTLLYSDLPSYPIGHLLCAPPSQLACLGLLLIALRARLASLGILLISFERSCLSWSSLKQKCLGLACLGILLIALAVALACLGLLLIRLKNALASLAHFLISFERLTRSNCKCWSE